MSRTDLTTVSLELGADAALGLWQRNHRASEVVYARRLREELHAFGQMALAHLRPHLGDFSALAAVNGVDGAQAVKRLIHTSVGHLRVTAQIGASSELLVNGPSTTRRVNYLTRRGLPVGYRAPLPPDVQAAINAWLAQLSGQPFWAEIVTGIKAEVTDVISQALADGKSGEEMARALQKVLGGNASSARAMRIARTESTGALNAGHAAARERLGKLGMLKGKEWACISDNDTRPDHRKADGQTVGPDEKFTVGGESADHPGDLSLSVAQRVNCRCTTLALMKDPSEWSDEAQPEATAPVVVPTVVSPPPAVADHDKKLPSNSDLLNATFKPFAIGGSQHSMAGNVGRVVHNGKSYFFKRVPDDVSKVEEAAAESYELMGLAVPALRHVTVPGAGSGSLSEWTDGQTLADSGIKPGDKRVKREDAERLYFGTILSGTNDRHDGNFMIGADGKLYSIDHEYAYSGHDYGMGPSYGMVLAQDSAMSNALSDFCKEPHSRAVVEEIASKADAVAKALRRRGLHDAADQVLCRGEALRRYAAVPDKDRERWMLNKIGNDLVMEDWKPSWK